MERGLIFEEKPPFILDLGTGYSNVHMNVEAVLESSPVPMGEDNIEAPMVQKWKADVQRVKNPVTYDRTVDSAVKDEFPDGADEAALRKGILNKDDLDFKKLFEFAEYIKTSYKNGLNNLS